MELVVRKTDLVRELQLFQGIVERKNTIPILANVLIEADGDQVRLLATDLEVGLRSKCQASVAKGGSLTLPAKKLYEIIKALPETDVRIEEDKNGVKVAAERFDSMSLVSTDGHRLALITVPRDRSKVKGKTEDEVRVILPRKTLLELGR